jgi:hypothetical protein
MYIQCNTAGLTLTPKDESLESAGQKKNPLHVKANTNLTTLTGGSLGK